MSEAELHSLAGLLLIYSRKYEIPPREIVAALEEMLETDKDERAMSLRSEGYV